MNGLVRCNRCGHGVVSHGDVRCDERGCACPLSGRSALDSEIVLIRIDSHGTPVPIGKPPPRVRPGAETPFGQRVRELRIDRGWSQSRLAVHSGVERTTLQRIEAGLRRDPGFSIVIKLARAFGVSIDTFAVLM